MHVVIPDFDSVVTCSQQKTFVLTHCQRGTLAPVHFRHLSGQHTHYIFNTILIETDMYIFIPHC